MAAQMKLYLLRREVPVKQYDVANGFVVAAEDIKAARGLVAHKAGDEGPGVWLEGSRSSCMCIANRTNCKRGIVMRDFNAG